MAQPFANLQFTNLVRSNGLPEENVGSIVEDSRGFLWMGTVEGLFRYDGHAYKSFYARSADTAYFSSNNINVIAEHLPGKLLFISASELWEVNIRNFEIRQEPLLKSKQLVISPVALADGRWMTCDKDSFYLINRLFSHYAALPYPTAGQFKGCHGIIPMQHPYVFVNGPNNVNHILNYHTGQWHPFFIDYLPPGYPGHKDFITRFYDSISRQLYFTGFPQTTFSVSVPAPDRQRYTATLLTAYNGITNTRTMRLLPGGLLFQGGDNGFCIGDDKKIVYYHKNSTIDRPFLGAVVQNITPDRKGNYWLSTNEGISMFNLKQPPIGFWRSELLLQQDDELTDIVKGSDGNVYAAFLNTGVLKISPRQTPVQPVRIVSGSPWKLQEQNGVLFIGGSGPRLSHYHMRSGAMTTPGYLKPYYSGEGLVTLVYKARNGDLWYSTNNGGGLVRNPAGTGNYEHYHNRQQPAPFTHRQFHTVAEDREGNLWFSYNRNGTVAKWVTARQRFEEYDVAGLVNGRFSSGGIECLHVDAADNLWISTGANALIRYHIATRTGECLDMNKGLPTDIVNAICHDKKNRTWLATGKGVCCYLPDTKKLVTFTTSDGLPEDNLRSKGVFYDVEDDRVYVGGKRSIIYFNPDSLLQRAAQNDRGVFIEDMMVNGKPYFFGENEQVALQPDENNISFSFTAPDYERSGQLEFEYQLEGNSKTWLPVGSERKVTFNNLPSGNYILSVRAKYKGAEQWRETPAPLGFTIKTPWYRTAWFYMLVVAAAGFAIWFVIRQYYKRKIEQQKAIVEKQRAVELERNRIAADMHDDLGSGLTRINYATQMAISKQPTVDDLLRIRNISTGLVENMREIIRAMKEENNTLEELLFYVKNYAMEYCAAHGLNCHVHLPETLYERQVLGQNRRHIYLTVKELLHNIVKHAHARNVYLAAAYDKEWVVTIRDDGKGMPDSGSIKQGNGLKNLRKRMEAVGGQMEFHADANGTMAILRIPL
jgi:signal transduction histidine kinase